MTLSIIGQRVLPQRNLAPLHITHRLSCRLRVIIWLSSKYLWLFKMSFNQLSEARILGRGVVVVMLYFYDDCDGLICFSNKFNALNALFAIKLPFFRGEKYPRFSYCFPNGLRQSKFNNVSCLPKAKKSRRGNTCVYDLQVSIYFPYIVTSYV